MSQLDLGRIVKDAMEAALRERGHVNVLIAGRTGVGKSTLINAVFQGDFATTGQGKPVTLETREIGKEGVPLTIFDTRGLELLDFKATMASLESLVMARSRDKDANRHIHVAWVCIQEPGRRVEDAESELVAMLAKHMPVIGVITKSMNDGGFRAEVQKLLPQARNVVRVRAIPEVLDDGHKLEPMGLEDLVTLTMECVPEGHRRAFTAAQKASIASKVKHAHGVVATAAAGAATAAAVPVPFADAAMLVPIQVGMLAGISATFGLELTTGFLTTLAASAAGGTAATFAGRALAGNLLKLVPGAGSVAGGAIAATTAVAVTTALGEAYIGTLATVFAASEGEPPGLSDVSDEFERRMNQARGA